MSSSIEYEAAKVLAVIRSKPHDYQDALELQRKYAPRYEDLMTYVGMYVQGVLIINDSFYQITSDTMFAYETCCRTIRAKNLASARPIPQNVRIQFQKWLRARLPISWLGGFLREYRLHLFGNVMWVDDNTREYVSDFNDPRFLPKVKGIWSLDYKPLKDYDNYEEIRHRLEIR